MLGVAPSLVAVVIAVCVSIAEQCCWQACPVCASRLAVRANWLIRVEERLGRRHLGGHVAVVHHVLEVADLTVDVKVQTSGALKAKDL